MKVLNWRDIIGDWPANAVNIMRPGPWGNPFRLLVHGNRLTVIRKFEEWLRTQPALIERARRELRGKVLVCCCAPNMCHGDVWVKILEEKS